MSTTAELDPEEIPQFIDDEEQGKPKMPKMSWCSTHMDDNIRRHGNFVDGSFCPNVQLC